MGADPERGADPHGGAAASDVVRRRLVQLIRELQQPTAEPQRTGRRILADAPGPPGVPDSPGGPPPTQPDAFALPGEEEDWLDRLRRPNDDGPPDSEAVGPAAVTRRMVARGLEFGREHLAAVIVVLLVGVAWTAYSLLQARSAPVAAAAPVIQATPSLPAATPSGAGQVVVHVIGAVREPGIVKLPTGSRVADAIAAAGGLSETAAPGELNLAQVLDDGVQLKIGTRKHPGGWLRTGTDGQSSGSSASTGSSGTESSKVSLNSATLEQLDTLPGIGPVTAQKILDWRKAHGKFSAITELQEVDGIGPKTYADIADHVRL